MNRKHAITTALFVVGAGLALTVRPSSSLAIDNTPPVPASNYVATINWYETHQTIEGFGTSEAQDYAAILHNWPEPQRSQILDLGFSQASGIGLTILRSQVSTGPYSLLVPDANGNPVLTVVHDVPSLEPSPGVWNYSDPDQVWLMQEAARRTPVKLIASVWSPPAWMKDSNDLLRGDITPAHYQDFADYLAHYAGEYAWANGVSIYAISMTNEPDTVFSQDDINQGKGWPNCTWTGDQIATFLASYLAPTFANRHLTTKIIAPEPGNWDNTPTYFNTTLNTPAALARVDIMAAHIYGGDPTQPLPGAQANGKPVWQTEASLRHPVWTWDGAVDWAKEIHTELTQGQVTAWLWWVLALWHGDENLISLDTDQATGAQTYRVSPTFWAFGNFSKFIRPGFVRIGTSSHYTDMPPAGHPNYYKSALDVSAYRDPSTDQLVVVVINESDSPSTVSFGFDTAALDPGPVTPYLTGGENGAQLAPQPETRLTTAQTIPERSVVTYVSHTRSFELWATTPNVQYLVGDYNGDGRADVGMLGGDPSWWHTMPAAFSSGDGTFRVTNADIASFNTWVTTANAKLITGDFNGDGRTDLALVGGSGWTFIPVALSNGDGSFRVTSSTQSDFAGWATAPNVKPIVGDFDGDGRTDIALIGGDPSWWHTMPIAFSNGDGTFRVTNVDVGSFNVRATTAGAKLVAGDYNGDGRTDVALVGGSGWTFVPVALSNGDGTFRITEIASAAFAGWATTPNVVAIPGDFNHDGRADIALLGGDPSWWHTMPVAFSNGDGSFTVTNADVASFNVWATTANAKIIPGDYNGDGRTDVALVGGNWGFVPVALSNGNGSFAISSAPNAAFAGWATAPGVRPLVGDFNGDGRTDLALLGGDPMWWYTLPVAFSNGDGSFNVTNSLMP